MTTHNGIDLSNVMHEDVLDGEELVSLLEAAEAGEFGTLDDDDRKVVADIRRVLEDHQPYPEDVSLIADSYFLEHAQEMAEDIGAIPSEHTWPTSYIDWDRAARDLRMDYTCYAIGGVTFWGRP